MKKNFFLNFILCGLSGWCMECCCTGLSSLRTNDKKLTCTTSLWMFPIYGCAAIIGPISRYLRGVCCFFRGLIYGIGILLAEYGFGTLLQKHHCCPWNYKRAKYNYKGLIRFDYLPFWALAGLFFEWLTTHSVKN